MTRDSPPLLFTHLIIMATKTALKPRPIRKVNTKMTEQKKVVNIQPAKVVIEPEALQQGRKLNELSLFELGLLPFLYLEYGIKLLINEAKPLLTR